MFECECLSVRVVSEWRARAWVLTLLLLLVVVMVGVVVVPLAYTVVTS